MYYYYYYYYFCIPRKQRSWVLKTLLLLLGPEATAVYHRIKKKLREHFNAEIMKINTIAFQSKADHTQTYTDTAFCSCDLDLYPLSLIYKLDPDIHKTCVHAKNELSRSSLSEVRGLQTDARD